MNSICKRKYHLTGDTRSKARFIFDGAKLKSKNSFSDDTQTWIRGKANSEGYFTLQNKATGKYLTAATTLQIQVASE